MARYIVTLSLAESSECAVSREVTRSDDERAIFYAQNLLHKSRISTRILWQWFDTYTVKEVIKDGTERDVATGAGEERECYRAGYQRVRGSRGSGQDDSSRSGRVSQSAGKGKPADTRPDYLPIRKVGAAKGARKPRELSPYQLKMRATVDAAKERLRADGHVPRMGSNTHD